MDLNYLLSEFPTWLAAVIFVGFWILFTVAVQILVRWKFGNETLRKNNELAGYKFGVQGVSYSVLLAFVVILVWENHKDVELAVSTEARAIVDLKATSQALPDKYKEPISKALKDYVNSVRNEEWNTMSRKGEASPNADLALKTLTSTILNIEPTNYHELVLYQAALNLLRTINDSRIERVASADGSISPSLWIILFVGALITFVYPAFFGGNNFYSQILMTVALTVTLALTLFMVISLNYPFSGTFSIDPPAFTEHY